MTSKNDAEMLDKHERQTETCVVLLGIELALEKLEKVLHQDTLGTLYGYSSMRQLCKVLIINNMSTVTAGISSLIDQWRTNDFRNLKNKTPVKYADIYKRIDILAEKFVMHGVPVWFWCVGTESNMSANQDSDGSNSYQWPSIYSNYGPTSQRQRPAP